MNASQVQSALVEVLGTIQKTSGLDCPTLTGQTTPVEELPDFDSKIWPVATGMLAEKLGITIPDDVNIFTKKDTDTALTIDEIVEVVLNLAKTQTIAVPNQVDVR